MNSHHLNMYIKRILGDKAKKGLVKLMFPFRNRFMLFNWSNRAVNHRVNLNYWCEAENLGDALSPVVVNHMLAQKSISPECSVDARKHLYAVGSVLTAGIQDATVWGSGVLNASLTYRLQNRKLDIRAVRGPITRAILKDYGFEVPQVYGDPAVLMPEIYPAKPSRKRAKFGLVIHKDYDVARSVSEGDIDDDVFVLDIRTKDYKAFIDRLISVEVVISSSLHGIILAEAYGVPAVLLQPQVDYLKYDDYYCSTGRTEFPVAGNLKEAKKTVPPALPDLNRMREELKNAFPYDLYQEKLEN